MTNTTTTDRTAYYRRCRLQGWNREAARILATHKTDEQVAACLALFKIVERREERMRRYVAV